MGRRKKGEDDTIIKDRLIDRIGELFFTRGLTSYTMDEMSQTFQVSKKTLYRFFPTKEDVVVQVAGIFISRMKAFVQRRLAKIEARGPEAFVAMILELIGRFGSILLAMPPSLIFDLERKSPLLFERIEAIRGDAIMDMFSRILDTGKRLGKIRRDIDSEVGAHVYAGIIRQIVSRQGLGPAHAPYEVFQTAIEILFDGLLVTEAKSDFGALRFPRFQAGNLWRDMKKEAEE